MRAIITVCAVLTIALCDVSQAEPSRLNLNIEPQPMRLALKDLGQQTGLSIVFRAEEGAWEVLQAPRIEGELSAQEALEKMLANTGLTYKFVNSNTVWVSAGAGVEAEKTALRPEGEEVRMAQADISAQESQASVEAKQGAVVDEDMGHSPQLQEIVVTAQKRQERLQDVPISIAVLSGADLDRSTAEGITELLNRVPGVATTVNVQGGGTQVAVRGVAASGPLFFGSSPIAYYLDSVPFGLVKTAIGPDSNAFDLQRVEVLRGPQGTLYGANAQNGVVRVLTQDAGLEQFEFKGRTSASSTKDGAENYRGDVAINVPLIEGKLGARAVVGYQDLGGWIDRPNDEDANDAELRSMRLKLNAQPTDKLTIGLSSWFTRDDYGAPPVSADGAAHSSVIEEPITTDYDALGLKIGYEFARFSLTSMTSYLDYANDGAVDLAPPPLSSPGLVLFTQLKSKVFSQEVILDSARQGLWRWSLGGFYRDGRDRLFQIIPPDAFVVDYVDTSESYAAFGEVGRRFLDRAVELTLGLRYFHDDVGNDDNTAGALPYHPRESFNSTTPRAVLTWYPNANATLYSSYSEGFRSGFPQNANVDFAPLKPDKLHNYEIGAKAALWEGRLTLDSAIYYIDWQDVQQPLTVTIPGTVNNVSALVNGESASGMGVDFGLTARPIEGLELGVTVGWSDLAMDADVRLPPEPGNPQGAILFAKGDRLNLSPEYTMGASVDYVFALGGLTGRFSTSANYLTEQSQRTSVGVVPVSTFSDSMFLTRTSFSIEDAEHWTASLFVENLNNEEGAVLRDTSLVPDFSVRVRPRTIGLQIEYRL